MGLRTIAIDTGERKEKLCKQLGVEKWIDFRDTQDVAGEIVSFTGRPPDSDVLVIREGYVRLDGWCSRAHVSSRMVSRASELVNLLLIQ